MQLCAYHKGKSIPYWLGVILALDQFAGFDHETLHA